MIISTIKKLRTKIRNRRLRNKIIKEQRDNLAKAGRHLIDFCWPDGDWRGYANMKGLLEVLQPLMRGVKTVEWDNKIENENSKCS